MAQSLKPGAPTPWQRLVGMLRNERTTINYIFIYALLNGAIGLSLPLGVTAIFNMLSNGAMFSSTYILIAVVLIGVVIGGLLLIAQLTLVEAIEQKIFARASIEFAYRLPRIKKNELDGTNPPELVNRFFDVITIQKGLGKLLIDITAAVVQILFSAILLSFYHPVFIGFGMLTILVIGLLFLLYYREGVQTSLEESSHKYKLVAYLEDIAGTLNKHRDTDEGKATITRKTDHITSKYLKARNSHFNVLRKFFAGSVVLRFLLMGSLLLLGAFFVVNRQMTLGQFVAAEVIIVQISYAVEKFLTSLDTIFDMVTGSEKIAAVTDLELEETETYHD